MKKQITKEEADRAALILLIKYLNQSLLYDAHQLHKLMGQLAIPNIELPTKQQISSVGRTLKRISQMRDGAIQDALKRFYKNEKSKPKSEAKDGVEK